MRAKNTLIPHNSPACVSEPKTRHTSHGRDGIRSHVRACLLRDRDLSEFVGQVQRDFGYSEATLALIKHFYKVEVVVS